MCPEADQWLSVFLRLLADEQGALSVVKQFNIFPPTCDEPELADRACHLALRSATISYDQLRAASNVISAVGRTVMGWSVVRSARMALW